MRYPWFSGEADEEVETGNRGFFEDEILRVLREAETGETAL